MNEHDSANTSSLTPSPPEAAGAERSPADQRRESRRWWTKLLLQPALFLFSGLLLLIGLGIAQRSGWITDSGHPGEGTTSRTDDPNQLYICPMMCTPPLREPGRCPVCKMELVPAASRSATSDSESIQIDPVARRVANIQTAVVQIAPLTRTIRVMGKIDYDEGAVATIASYVDGRLERLFADYTGLVVNKGDSLAVLYSPQLYASQVEYLITRRADSRSVDSRGLAKRNSLVASARQRLLELGVTKQQLTELERAGQANSRMRLVAPIDGTVIEKMAVAGQYVKEGQTIYRLADLSVVWLMLELFPEDAADVRYGQKVVAQLQSLPGQTVSGRVAFVDPVVNPRTRTIGVRVALPNPGGRLKIGDLATATIDVPVGTPSHGRALVYDPEIANQWISPRHPEVISDSPGSCPKCGEPLIAASQLGFTADPVAERRALLIPRDAVLMAGDHSVAYVETAPGRFELRRITVGQAVEDRIVVLTGVSAGERVAVRGNFLIDSQMQLAGNPSLIDPLRRTRQQPAARVADEADTPTAVDDEQERQIAEALAQLSPADRELAVRQRTCPVADSRLGSMGPPEKVDVNGTPVFICCDGCRSALLSDPRTYLDKLAAAADEADQTRVPAPPPEGGRPAAERTPASPALERSSSPEHAPHEEAAP